MRHLRPFAALLGIAALTMACSSPGASSGGDGSQPAEASQPAASTGGGGGGGGGAADGSIVYEITGDYQASGELPFLGGGVSLWIEPNSGWVANFGNTSGEGAAIVLNTQEAEETIGQSFTYGDGTIILSAGSSDTGMGCTFNLDQNDSSGLSGDLECTSAIALNNTTGAQLQVRIHAEWDGP